MTSVGWRHDQTPGDELAVAELVPAVCDVLAAIALLIDEPPPAPPAFHEVRDGLIVRWIDTPG